ncbi:MAG: aldo/keto reductase [Planctomycetes bacterium]|nr:aldo/keto reductase [Planctomycetota bacterium]
MVTEKRPLNVSSYIYGAGDVGLPGYDWENDFELVRLATEAGVWIHSSPNYGGQDNAGGTIRFLRECFDKLGARVPMILKLYIKGYEGWVEGTTSDPRLNVEDMCSILGMDRVDIGQIWASDKLLTDLPERGPVYQVLNELRDEGAVGHYFYQLEPSSKTSEIELLLESGVVDGFMYYHNVIERDVSNDVYDLLAARGTPQIALRSFGHTIVDYATWDSATALTHPNASPETIERVDALRQPFEESGCGDWVEFCMGFAASLPTVLGTIGSTTKPEHLRANLAADQAAEPLEQKVIDMIEALQREWYATE